MIVVEPVGSSGIEIFVCSHSRDVDIEHYREMSYHVQCGLGRWAYGELASQFKGRIFADTDIEALNKVFEVAKKENREVKVHDTSRVAERMKALKRGILKTPAIVVNGIKYQGLGEIAQAITFRPTP